MQQLDVETANERQKGPQAGLKRQATPGQGNPEVLIQATWDWDLNCEYSSEQNKTKEWEGKCGPASSKVRTRESTTT